MVLEARMINMEMKREERKNKRVREKKLPQTKL